MAFRVEITEKAEQDADGILDWLISQHAGETGLRWFEGLDEAIASLSLMPGRRSVAPENAEFPFEVRQLLYGRKPHVYRVIFTIDMDTRICVAHPPWTAGAPDRTLTPARRDSVVAVGH